MRKIFVFLLVFFFNTAPAQSFSLEIVLDKDFPGYVYLHYDGAIDSSLVANKRLHFSGKLEKPVTQGRFRVEQPKYWRLDKPVYLENSEITIVAHVTQKKVLENDTLTTLEVQSVSGSRTNDVLHDYEGFQQQNGHRHDYVQKWLEKTDAVLTANPQNPIAGDLLYDLLRSKKYDQETLKKLYYKIEPNFQDEFVWRKIENELFPGLFVQTNGPVYNFSLPDKNGMAFDTQALKGKWIFIDFWASWCVPCREQFPELKRLRESYKSKGFEIVSVSIDKRHSDWIKALDEENPGWPNLIEGQGNSGPIAKKYNLSGVPANYLIDPSGKIIAQRMELALLEKILLEFL